MKAKLVISPVLMSMIGLLMTGLMLSCDDVNENSGMNNLSAAEESCVDGSAICRDDENPGLYSENGPYRTDRYTLTGVSPNGAVVHYPKVFLEGDYRWAPYIQRPALAGTWETASLL